MKDLNKDGDFGETELKLSKLKGRLVSSSKEEGKRWYIFTDLEEESLEEVIKKYGNRFQCEKIFQDEKSSGFEIEKSKIKNIHFPRDFSSEKSIIFT